MHCMKSVRIRSFSGPYFPAVELNTERYGVSLRIQSKCGKIRTRKISNTETFHSVTNMDFGVNKATSASINMALRFWNIVKILGNQRLD